MSSGRLDAFSDAVIVFVAATGTTVVHYAACL